MMKKLLTGAVMLAAIVFAAPVAAQMRATPPITMNDAMGQFWGLNGFVSGSGVDIAVQCTSGCSGSSAISAVTATSRGITLTTGGTDQTIAAANATRKVLVIQNPCVAVSQGIAAAESVFVNIGAAASLTSNANFAELPACASVTLMVGPGLVDQEAIHVNAATTGHIIYAKEF